MTDENKAAQPGLEALVADIVRLCNLSMAIERSRDEALGPHATEYGRLQQDVLSRIRDLYAAKAVHQCNHRIADGRNPVVTSGYMCIDCGALFAAADHGKLEAAPAQPVAAQPDELKTWPKHIWLQSGESEVEEYTGSTEDMTWCEDNINRGDVKYVRADLAAAPPALQESKDALSASGGWSAAKEAAAFKHGFHYRDNDVSEVEWHFTQGGLQQFTDAAIAASKSKGGVRNDGNHRIYSRAHRIGCRVCGLRHDVYRNEGIWRKREGEIDCSRVVRGLRARLCVCVQLCAVSYLSELKGYMSTTPETLLDALKQIDRDAFEKMYAETLDADVSFIQMDGKSTGKYHDPYVQLAWHAWEYAINSAIAKAAANAAPTSKQNLQVDGAPTEQAEPVLDDLADLVSKAMNRAYNLGQTFWQQADSESYAANRRSDETQRKFDQLADETRAAILALSQTTAGDEPSMTVTIVDGPAYNSPSLHIRKWDNRGLGVGTHKLYTRPQPQELPMLSDEEIDAVWDGLDGLSIIRGENLNNHHRALRRAFARNLLSRKPSAESKP